MIALGIQACAQFLTGIRIACGHAYLMELFNVLQMLGNSYRLASTAGGGSGLVYGRFAVCFCRAIVARVSWAVGDGRMTVW